MDNKISIGVDIGSTTIKMYATQRCQQIIKEYRRHYSKINESLLELFKDNKHILDNHDISITFSGSAGLRYSEDLGFGYLQEVIAASRSVKSYVPQTRTAIELGGEDAKIIYFEDSLDHRMNGVCAGGTGAFIDQMAQLLNVQASDLNELAKSAEHIYPIASRCGVFAKTDVQPLLNQGANKADVAASIFQAVVNQTIGALSRGKPLVAPIAFLGGPLTFLPELRKRFALTLGVNGDDAIIPEDSQYFVAKGAETESRHSGFTSTYNSILNSIADMENRSKVDEHINEPLFANDQEYEKFIERHSKQKVAECNIDTYEGIAYLGIDAGSTTSKIILLSKDFEVLYSYYGSNQGQTLEILRQELIKLLEKIDGRIKIAGAGATGYGEQLIQSAFNLDLGEVETVAHYRAASYFSPNVDFIIDIGGQDMKCFKVRNGAIENIILNEACSSGCGSFIETFAGGLGYSVQEFTKLGVKSQYPVELGTRCTVFMNSKVKQAQKEGYSVSDISAGLALSVVKNALFKVIRLKNVDDLGENIVVQGGTFYNDAVLRAFEQVLNKEVIRPNIAGLMGAFGVALLSAENSHGTSSILSLEELRNAKYSSRQMRCRACSNACTLTVNKFGDRNIISGNKCEKGDSSLDKKEHLPDMMEYKYQRVFNYSQEKNRKFTRGKMGIMRVLNFYENYPFWFTFFDKLDFEVILSSDSTVEMMNNGVSSVVSENICYPAKMAHGHIVELLELKVPNVFYPCLSYNVKEDSYSQNHYNCPIVTSYPELIAKNVPNIEDTNFIYPYLPFDDPERLTARLYEELGEQFNISSTEIKNAVHDAFKEFDNYKSDLARKGEETLAYLKEHNHKGIVLVGRPYHMDWEVSHGLSRLVTSLGFAVLTEDSISHLEDGKDINIVDQWVYHSRMFRAAKVVASNPNLELVQLNSFGCGLDGVTVDEVRRIIEKSGKIYTQIKIDEVSNLGAIKIRLRSLDTFTKMARLKQEPVLKGISGEVKGSLKDDYTLLIPEMSPYHFEMICGVLGHQGYKAKILESFDVSCKDAGLKHVNNEMCYPALLSIGQIISHLKSGKYDVNKVAVMMSQTGGGCRASNYIVFLRQALEAEGLSQVPVVSFNAHGMDKQSIPLNFQLVRQLIFAVLYGDLLMKLAVHISTYEKVAGEGDRFKKRWLERLRDSLYKGETKKSFNNNVKAMVQEFVNTELHERNKPRVGIVGEVYVKYQPFANSDLINLLIKEGAEPIVPNLYNFFLYSIFDLVADARDLKRSKARAWVANVVIYYMDSIRNVIRQELANCKFDNEHTFKSLTRLSENFISLSNKMGEGWLLTGEMAELMEDGVSNVVCLQPFGCLPNHVCGKGMMKPLKEKYPQANILPLDYDPEISFTNQVNRIKLMLATALEGHK